MKLRRAFELPAPYEALQKRARRLAWWSIALLGSATLGMYAVAGSSQAMKTAWLEDSLSLIPPIAYLIATRIARRGPNREFPYGYHRSISIAFLCSAIALLGMGVLLSVESIVKLVTGEHPTLQSVEIFGQFVWQGWPMLVMVVVTGVIPVVLGHLKLPIARTLHDKALHADADMNKADWLTALAALFGVLGIAWGWWWSDAAAGAFISLAITHDGFKNLRRVILDLMDRSPTHVDSGAPLDVADKLAAALEALDWISAADVRLREEGHVFSGEAFIVPKDEKDLLDRAERVRAMAGEMDWRLSELVVTFVKSLEISASER
ncbi:MAG TPA: cation diffusion facilitator family transporter [Polyangiaceae bacterium]|nr:cation diffusion facilitator family transporter [Polyangiaceae bacterium]